MFDFLARFFYRSRMFLNRDGAQKQQGVKLPKGCFVNSFHLNADTGEKIRIVPVGSFPEHPDGPHEITREHLEQMVNNQKTDIMIDLGHEAIWNAAAPAYGWIAQNSLEVRDDGLYSDYPDFNPDTTDLIKNRTYRFLSPAYTLMNRDKQGRQIGAKLYPIALTNRPYMDEEISHLRNSEAQKEDAMSVYSKELKTKLGLAEDAEDSVVETKLDELVKAAEKIAAGESGGGQNDDGGGDGDGEGTGKKQEEDATVAMNSEIDKRLKALEAEREAAKKNSAEALIDTAIAAGKILPAHKEVWLNSALGDYAKTKTALDAIKSNAAMPGSVTTPSGEPVKKNAVQAAAEYFKAQGRYPAARA